MEKILDKTLSQWIQEFPDLEKMIRGEEFVWRNERPLFSEAIQTCPLTMNDVMDASSRLARFANYFKVAYPETQKTDGIIESEICELVQIKHVISSFSGMDFTADRWLMKLDSQLPISGSIKARGGIYEVLATAEKIAIDEGFLHEGDDYSVFATEKFKNLFSQYTIAVGSTGNLGLSIGLVGAKLGFHAEVHMSADARQWKKDMLRRNGATVIEYGGDYSVAVAQGRKAAETDPYCHFVDDENSKTLFLGYAVAALRLKKQLEDFKIEVSKKHPLYVYLPCGVGGGPGGVAFGLKLIYGDFVHCYFAEPTHSCCMTLGMLTGKHNQLSVQDFGIDNRTVADGLAVGRASGFVGKLMEPFVDGCYTVTDEKMLSLESILWDVEQLFLEPSSLASLNGPMILQDHGCYEHGTHLFWATGGGMVPDDERLKYYDQGRSINSFKYYTDD